MPTTLEDRAGKIESKTSANMSRVFGVGKQATDRTQFKQIEFRNQAGTGKGGREKESGENSETSELRAESCAEPSWVFRAETDGVQLAHKSKWRQLCTALLMDQQGGG